MRVLFTRSNLVGSKVIQWGLEEPVSHVALEEDEVVLHSTWGNVDLDHIDTFLESREIVFEIEVPVYGMPDMLDMARRYEGSKYDFRALIYFGWRAFLRKFFGRPFPKTNKLNTPGNFLCTEIATMLIYGEEDGIITPYELYTKLKET